MSTNSLETDLVDKLVYANRILYDHNIVDGLGHVSVRHPSKSGAFLLSCNRAPGLVCRRDTSLKSMVISFLSGESAVAQII